MDTSGIPDWLVIGEDRSRNSRVQSSNVAFVPLHLSSEHRSVQTKGLNSDLLHAMVFVQRFDNQAVMSFMDMLQELHHDHVMTEAMAHADRGVVAIHIELYPADFAKTPESLLHEIAQMSKTNHSRTQSLEFAYGLQTGYWPFSPYTIEMGREENRKDYILSDPFAVMPEEAFPPKALQVDFKVEHSLLPHK
jgi:hypothetical protein